MATEAELIATLSRVFGDTPLRADLLVGIGDDAAVLKESGRALVAGADMAVEGVHFRRDWSSLAQIGGKLAVANFADIYAMGAEPKYLLVTAGLTPDIGIEEIEELAIGIKQQADAVGAIVVGGDLSSSPVLTMSMTAMGEMPAGRAAITRAGARVGDTVVLSGVPGYSAAGLAALRGGRANEFTSVVKQHQLPVLDIAAAKAFAATGVNSMCDVSDGLLSELGHIAKASGVGIEISSAILASPVLDEIASKLGADVWEWILAGGEDHLFVGTTSGAIPEDAIAIGSVIQGDTVRVVDRHTPEVGGFSHFT
jgi:thiamine-monophosphate kinase